MSEQQTLQRSKKSITLEKEIETKVRKIQARLIEKTDQNWSMSTVLNLLVSAGIYQTKKMSKNDWQNLRESVENKTIRFDESLIADFVKKLS